MDKNEEQILEYISKNPSSSSREIHEGSELKIGYATVKRILNRLHVNNFKTYVTWQIPSLTYSKNHCSCWFFYPTFKLLLTETNEQQGL